jgi:hypothetical protein
MLKIEVFNCGVILLLKCIAFLKWHHNFSDGKCKNDGVLMDFIVVRTLIAPPACTACGMAKKLY